jgi:hypothetical protein
MSDKLSRAIERMDLHIDWLALRLSEPLPFEKGRARCLSCGTYMAKVIKGRYQCKQCGRQLRTDEPKRGQDFFGQRALADRIYTVVCDRKAVSLPTLHRRFSGERLDEALQQLAREGRIEIQQNGYIADSLHHHKLVVVREVSAAKSPRPTRKVHPAGEAS